MRPMTVEIMWSESPEFRAEQKVDFVTFEYKARRVARAKGSNGGYHKTMVRVHFDSPEDDPLIYEVRLDLAEDQDHGFEHHIRNLRGFLATEKGERLMAEIPNYRKTRDVIAQMDL